MFKLGIIGSDNSHAIAFSQLANLEEGRGGLKIPDVQVTHIYGTDPERTKEVAEAGQIPHIATKSEEMLAAVDGVICVWRHGAKHLPDTLPFIKAGKPAFIDKPLATTVADARQLIETAQQAKIGFSSFSTLRYAQPTVDFIAALGEGVGEVVSGVSTGPAHLDSEYGGIFFYGIHAVELMHAAFGYGVESVSTVANGPNAHVACAYPDGRIVTLNLLGDKAKYAFHLTAFGSKGLDTHLVDSATAYYEGMRVFVDAMKNGTWPLTPEQLLEPVQVLVAAERSMETGRAVTLAEVS